MYNPVLYQNWHENISEGGTADYITLYIFYTSSLQWKGADHATKAVNGMVSEPGFIWWHFLKIWEIKINAESMAKKLFCDLPGGKICLL